MQLINFCLCEGSMLTIRNNTEFAFEVQLGDGIQGPNFIVPNNSSQYGCPGSVPQTVLTAMGPGGRFSVIHESDGSILLIRDETPLARIGWGGEFTLVPIENWTAIPR